MKQTFMLLAATLCLLLSCGKTPENGALDGMWQLMETSEVQADGTYAAPVSRKADGIYWNFQLQLLMIHSQNDLLNGHTFDTAARFRFTGSKLEITQTYIHFDNRDSLLTDPATQALEPLGIRGNAAAYDIEQLDGKRMVLVSKDFRLVFRKF